MYKFSKPISNLHLGNRKKQTKYTNSICKPQAYFWSHFIVEWGIDATIQDKVFIFMFWT